MVNMIDTGNTAWVLLCTALVFFMTPGLALFYGGMARSKKCARYDHAELLFNWRHLC